MVHEGTCRARRRDGQPCSSAVVLASGYCAMHDPARQAEMAAARIRGGRHKATKVRVEKLVPAVLRPVLTSLLAALPEVRDGTLTTQQAGALASLASAIVRVYTTGTLEERVAALEATPPERNQTA